MLTFIKDQTQHYISCDRYSDFCIAKIGSRFVLSYRKNCGEHPAYWKDSKPQTLKACKAQAEELHAIYKAEIQAAELEAARKADAERELADRLYAAELVEAERVASPKIDYPVPYCTEEETDSIGGSALVDRLLCQERGIVCGLPRRKEEPASPKPLKPVVVKKLPPTVAKPVVAPKPAKPAVVEPAPDADAWLGRDHASRLVQALAKASTAKSVPHLIIEARAGTGKTTTLVEGLKRIRGMASPLVPSPQQDAVWKAMAEGAANVKSICMVAFNKSIAQELASRVPAGVDAMTMHSMGFRAVRAAFGKVEMGDFVVSDLISEVMGVDGRELRNTRAALVIGAEKLVKLCKMNLVDGQRHELEELERHHDLELDLDREEIFRIVPLVLERCRNGAQQRKKIDFDDMIWLPVVLDLPVHRYDMLLVDEAQDLNRCQQALARKVGRRLVLCGDPKQAIYGFAGADAESMPRMAEELGNTEQGCRTLPLTVTRRCGHAIVAEAKEIVPDFDSFPTNPAGEILRMQFPGKRKEGPEVLWEKSYAAEAKAGDMLLCRVNAPLVSQCFRFLRRGIRAQIQGRDIGAGLVSLVKKLNAKTVPDLISKLEDWCNREMEKEQAKRNSSEARLIAIQDKADCLLCFTEEAITASTVVAKIESMFTDANNAGAIRLSSIHKAKGLEAKRVFLLEPEGASVPHPMARKDWQREQEWNLRYVAITRAIETLVYVS